MAEETKPAVTTVQISVPTRDKLKEIAEAYQRSQVGQLTWMVDQEYARLKELKLLPEDVKKAKHEAPKVK